MKSGVECRSGEKFVNGNEEFGVFTGVDMLALSKLMKIDEII